MKTKLCLYFFFIGYLMYTVASKNKTLNIRHVPDVQVLGRGWFMEKRKRRGNNGNRKNKPKQEHRKLKSFMFLSPGEVKLLSTLASSPEVSVFVPQYFQPCGWRHMFLEPLHPSRFECSAPSTCTCQRHACGLQGYSIGLCFPNSENCIAGVGTYVRANEMFPFTILIGWHVLISFSFKRAIIFNTFSICTIFIITKQHFKKFLRKFLINQKFSANYFK